MGASKKIKKILIDKELTQAEFAEMVMHKTKTREVQMRNALARDTFGFNTVEEWLDALDCDIIFRDRKTGRLYE